MRWPAYRDNCTVVFGWSLWWRRERWVMPSSNYLWKILWLPHRVLKVILSRERTRAEWRFKLNLSGMPAMRPATKADKREALGKAFHRSRLQPSSASLPKNPEMAYFVLAFKSLTAPLHLSGVHNSELSCLLAYHPRQDIPIKEWITNYYSLLSNHLFLRALSNFPVFAFAIVFTFVFSGVTTRLEYWTETRFNLIYFKTVTV